MLLTLVRNPSGRAAARRFGSVGGGLSALFGDLQQLRGLLIDIREIVEHMKYLFELLEIIIRS
jgi:hypothetical protein